MKVTVLSPVTADVTIAQATGWLVRNGWLRSNRRMGDDCVAWRDPEGAHVGIIASEHYHDSQERMRESITDIGYATNRPPAEILREMSSIVL